MKLKIAIRIIAVLQIVLGALYLVAPQWLLQTMGHSVVAPDIFYPLGMLAARFLVVGLVFWFVATDPLKYRLWLDAMIAIQAVDLFVGVSLTLQSTVALSLSGFPMFNAALIIALLVLWRPKNKGSTKVSQQPFTRA